MDPEHRYVGIHNDIFGGMTDLGRVIRDAWVFGILPEDETCEGWSAGRLQELYDKVHKAWEPYGHLVSRLPADLLARHRRIYAEAVRRARSLGWSAELDDDD
jgi:hypothetical protein